MRISRIIAAVAALPMVLGTVAADNAVYEACTNAGGATVVAAGSTVTNEVETPIGAPFIGGIENGDAGTYILDLAGLDVGTAGSMTLTLSWDTLLLADYDLNVNGTAYESSEDTELVSLTSLGHCSVVSAESYAFIGSPTDTLTMTVRGG